MPAAFTTPTPAGPGMLLLADGRFPAGGHAHSAGVESACADGRVTDEDSLAAYLRGRLRTTGLGDAALAAATVLLLPGTRPASAPNPAPARGNGAASGDRARAVPGARSVAEQQETHPDTADRALVALDVEAEARIAAPPLRAASRRLGRQLVRVGGRCWPDEVLVAAGAVHPDGPHQAVALGAVGRAARCTAEEVARLAVHHTLTTPAQAAVRLLGLDPFGVAALTARLAPLAAEVAAEAVAAARAATAKARAATAGAGAVPLAGLAGLPALSSPLVEVAAVEHRLWDVRLFAT